MIIGTTITFFASFIFQIIVVVGLLRFTFYSLIK